MTQHISAASCERCRHRLSFRDLVKNPRCLLVNDMFDLLALFNFASSIIRFWLRLIPVSNLMLCQPEFELNILEVFRRVFAFGLPTPCCINTEKKNVLR